MDEARPKGWQLRQFKFPPGQSGNKSGVPRAVWEARKLAQSMTPEALQKLQEWMRGDDARASIAACLAILDRALGKTASMEELHRKRQDGTAPKLELARLSVEQIERMHAHSKAIEDIVKESGN